MFSSFGLGRLGLLQNWGGGAGGAFSPLSLSPTAWYDPSDLSTLFQDAAGTTPVTADGDVVGLWQDKSGNGYHLTQGTTANKPLYKTAGGLHWIDFDGTDDALASANITPTGDTTQMFCGFLLDTVDGTTQIIAETSAISSTTAGTTGLFVAPIAGSEVTYRSRGTVNASVVGSAAVVGTSYVVSGQGDISSDSAILRKNQAETTSAADQGLGDFTAQPLHVGSRAGTSLFMDGRVYGLFLRFGAALTAGNVTDMETWMAAKSGVTL